MDAYASILMAKGLKGMIGRGSRGREVIEAMKKYKAVYFGATGGAEPSFQRELKELRLWPMRIWVQKLSEGLKLYTFLAIVVNDVYGHE